MFGKRNPGTSKFPCNAAIFLVLSMLPMLYGCAGKAAKTSQVLRLTIDSTYMNQKRPIVIYLPKGYGGGDHYPVWYGLHGYNSNENMWINSAGAADAADAMIAAGEIKPLIMVFPLTRYDLFKDIQADFEKEGKFGESSMDRFLCEELVPYIDSHYDTVKSMNGRSIGGFSMGGMIALRIAFHHPNMFGKVGGYSPSVASSDYSGRQLEKWLFPNDNVDEIADIEAFDKQKGLDKLHVYLDCGTAADAFSVGVQSLSECLRTRGVRTEFHQYEGGHDVQYAINNIREYLKFYGS
jgi:enterochelin esterase-like enzyme